MTLAIFNGRLRRLPAPVVFKPSSTTVFVDGFICKIPISYTSDGFKAPGKSSAKARSARLEDHFSPTSERSAAHRLPPVLVRQGRLFLGVPRHVAFGAARPSTDLGEIWGSFLGLVMQGTELS